jgi:hypothetical protein
LLCIKEWHRSQHRKNISSRRRRLIQLLIGLDFTTLLFSPCGFIFAIVSRSPRRCHWGRMNFAVCILTHTRGGWLPLDVCVWMLFSFANFASDNLWRGGAASAPIAAIHINFYSANHNIFFRAVHIKRNFSYTHKQASAGAAAAAVCIQH